MYRIQPGKGESEHTVVCTAFLVQGLWLPGTKQENAGKVNQ